MSSIPVEIAVCLMTTYEPRHAALFAGGFDEKWFDPDFLDAVSLFKKQASVPGINVDEKQIILCVCVFFNFVVLDKLRKT